MSERRSFLARLSTGVTALAAVLAGERTIRGQTEVRHSIPFLKQGVQLAVCQVATRGIAGTIAEATGGNSDAIYNELVASILSGARMVPAGTVAVNRAQERGYSFVSA